MKIDDIPRRIVSYEYLQVPVRSLNRGPISSSAALIFTLNMYAPQGWRMIEQYEVTSDNMGAYGDKFTYLDGVEITYIGKYKAVLFEREIREFRTPTQT